LERLPRSLVGLDRSDILEILLVLDEGPEILGILVSSLAIAEVGAEVGTLGIYLCPCP
jgi:hypothetical protein